jgi:hypothetical protein
MIQDNLENEIYAHISQTGKDISLIVMHPQTWINLTKEVFQIDSMEIYRYDPSLRYKGIRVLRSLDMVDGLFEIR